MKKLHCLVVEDEPLAAEGLEAYIREVPFLVFAGACRDAFAALELMQSRRIDVLFLDIHLPKLKGLDFLRSLERPPQVILTTAYPNYALEGYELNVVDYLLKPFGLPRFLAAVNKLRRPAEAEATAAAVSERPFHFFNENKRMVKVYHDEIAYVESLKEYVRLHLDGGQTVVTRYQLGELVKLLEGGDFLRIHRSYLVALAKIASYTATTVEAAGKELPIGRAYQEEVRRVLEKIG